MPQGDEKDQKEIKQEEVKVEAPKAEAPKEEVKAEAPKTGVKEEKKKDAEPETIQDKKEDKHKPESRIEEMTQGMGGFGSWMGKTLGNTIKPIREGIQEGLEKIPGGKLLSALVGGVFDIAENVIGLATLIVGTIANGAISLAGKGLKAAGKALAKPIKKLGRKIGRGVKKIAKKAGEKIKSAAKYLGNKIKDGASIAGRGLQAAGKAIGNGVKKLFTRNTPEKEEKSLDISNGSNLSNEKQTEIELQEIKSEEKADEIEAEKKEVGKENIQVGPEEKQVVAPEVQEPVEQQNKLEQSEIAVKEREKAKEKKEMDKNLAEVSENIYSKPPKEVYLKDDGDPTMMDFADRVNEADTKLKAMHDKLAAGSKLSQRDKEVLTEQLFTKMLDNKMRKDRVENEKNGLGNTPGDLEKKLREAKNPGAVESKLAMAFGPKIQEKLNNMSPDQLLKLTEGGPNHEMNNLTAEVMKKPEPKPRALENNQPNRNVERSLNNNSSQIPVKKEFQMGMGAR